MKNENKCFFSISLENGITLTSDCPGSVRTFLYEMHSAFFELGNHYQDSGLERLALNAFTSMKQISDAIDFINYYYDERH